MTGPPTSARTSIALERSSVTLALTGLLVGPTAVLLYETGRLDFFQAMPLLNVWAVVVCGLIGLGAGAAAVRRRAVLLGIICLVANGAVLGLYGFLAAFFSFGGSR